MKFSWRKGKELKKERKELEMLRTVSGIDYVIIVGKVCKSFIVNINQRREILLHFANKCPHKTQSVLKLK